MDPVCLSLYYMEFLNPSVLSDSITNVSQNRQMVIYHFINLNIRPWTPLAQTDRP